MEKLVKIVSIGGSDSIAGAGIQADIRTAASLDTYCATAVTCVTIQNSSGIKDIVPMDKHTVIRQLEAIFDDFLPDAVKIGMLPDIEIIKAVNAYLYSFHKRVKIVYDPITSPTLGNSLIDNKPEEYRHAMERLSSICFVTTPNLKEDAFFQNILSEYIIVKGGHGEQKDITVDRLFDTERNQLAEFVTSRVDTPNSHGTGCVYSTALACYLAQGYDIRESAKRAQIFVAKALKDGQNREFGSGYGPTLWKAITL